MFKFYNTLSRKIEEFKPNEEGKVAMYTCGPTVYHFAHIGNIRTYIMQDALIKSLEYAGYNVKRVMNITDVGHLGVNPHIVIPIEPDEDEREAIRKEIENLLT